MILLCVYLVLSYKIVPHSITILKLCFIIGIMCVLFSYFYRYEFVDFKMVGLLVPIECNLVILKQLVANALETSMPPSDITLQYQVDPSLPLVKISNDSAVEFYVELKK